jgi:uracil-DNA glycosylase
MYKDQNGQLKWLFGDPHYSIHKACLNKIQPSWRLGEKSSVAELFMCGSEDANIFYKINNLYQKYDLENYTCAEEYLIKYMELIKPKVIVSFGWLAMQWVQSRFNNDIKRNTQNLDDSFAKDYIGNPTRDKITRLHACFASIELDSGHISNVIFSLHPQARGFTDQEKQKLLRTVSYIYSTT